MSALTPILGTANSLTEVLAALNTALTSNGYTYNSTQKTFAKGSVACKLQIVGTGTAETLVMQAGTGVDGSGVLQNPAAMTPLLRAGSMGSGKTFNMTFPISYKIFIYTAPDLWVLSINHDTGFWQHMMNGNAINHGHTGLAGVVPFFYASYSAIPLASRAVNGVNLFTNLQGPGSGGNNAALPFWFNNNQSSLLGDNCGAYVNEPLAFNGINAMTWSPDCTVAPGSQHTWQNSNVLSNTQIVARLPNRWNNDSQLVPITVQAIRPSSFFSQAFELPHMRMMRNDFYNDGDIITYGPDSWMTLPARQKNTISRSVGINAVDHSGTYAFAFEYVAP